MVEPGLSVLDTENSENDLGDHSRENTLGDQTGVHKGYLRGDRLPWEGIFPQASFHGAA